MQGDDFYSSLYRNNPPQAKETSNLPYFESHEEALQHLAGLAQDEKVKWRGKDCYVVYCSDPDRSIARLLNHIKDTAAIGHSFDVVVDPDNKEFKEVFSIDGDGSDRIEGIVAIKKEDLESKSDKPPKVFK